MKVLLGVTGSVAAILATKLAEELLLVPGLELKIVATQRSLHFWNPSFLPHAVPFSLDSDEWSAEKYIPKESRVLHIDLRNWADILLIAPLSANTLAKMAQGFCDNLLTSVVRAWDRTKPIIIAPAMNTQMWAHPATEEHLSKFRGWYPKLQIISPISKMLACGEEGVGAMASIETITNAVSLWHEHLG